MQGRTLLAKVLHDVRAGLDVLCARPEVDAARVGFLGHSYGGRMALWAPAFDARIRASASHCGCVPYRLSLTSDAGIQAEFCVPGIMDAGDVDDVVRAVAPRPLLISATRADRWSSGAQELYDAARDGFPDGALELRLYDGGHAFTPAMRAEAYAFLARSLSA